MKVEATDEAARAAQTFLPFEEEGFLLTLTSKGIYIRSRKDYEALTEPPRLCVKNGLLEVSLAGAVVLLAANIKESRCTCPSRTTCKHVLMAIFAAADAAKIADASAAAGQSTTDAAGGQPEAKPEAADYAELENAAIEALKKEAGKKIWDEALSAVADGYGAAFTEGAMLAAVIDAYELTVYFPKKDSLCGAVCKCGEKSLCKHKLIAVLSYLEEKGKLTLDAERESAAPQEPVFSLMENAKRFTGALFVKGLISADEASAEEARQLSLKFETAGIGNFARLLRGAATDIENMLAKNAAFSHSRTFSSLSRVHTTASLILKNQAAPGVAQELIEKSRTAYRLIPHGSFAGLGAFPWQTRSGFTGVTALLWDMEKGRFCTYGASLPDFYDKTKDLSSLRALRDRYTSEDNWAAGLSLKAISEGVFTLRDYKINDERKLSSSKATLCSPLEKTSAAIWEKAAEISGAAGSAEASPAAYDYFGRSRGKNYAVVSCLAITGCRYDKARQRLCFLVCGEEEELPAVIPYSPVSIAAIRRIESLAAQKDFPARWFAGEITPQGFIPLCGADEKGVDSFYFGDSP
ncbi:MAG: SWIM zinc finger family protein [Spirochaetales bacterium]|jgi:hypothetical protein|nr:SWIM zinc finger family protein [Spirochaetales bacterium]